MNPTCTHVALLCNDVEASVQFYATHVGLHEIHRRTEHETTVVWMGEKGREDIFVIVLLGLPRSSGEGPVAHLGYAVASRTEVEQTAVRGRAAGLTVRGPVEAGPVVGYYCLLRDPDGNWVEFSYGQALGAPGHG